MVENLFFFVKKLNLPHISSSYAKILGQKLFRTWEFPQSGSKAKNGEEKERKKERLNDGDNNGQATHGAPLWLNLAVFGVKVKFLSSFEM